MSQSDGRVPHSAALMMVRPMPVRPPMLSSAVPLPYTGGGHPPLIPPLNCQPHIPPPPIVHHPPSTSVQSSTYNYSVPNGGKEKTPMCKIAELARYNRLCHLYKLVNESGPAHQKTFTVSLVLKSGEEYTGHGASIKKAQQDAAQVALDSTKLPKPQMRQSPRRNIDRPFQGPPLSPAVVLNVLAQQQGLVPIYKFIESHGHLPPFLPCAPGRFYRPSPTTTCRVHYVSLCLSDVFQCVGHGPNRQMARHHAAAQAIQFIQNRALQNQTSDSLDLTCNGGEEWTITTTTSGVVSDEEDSKADLSESSISQSLNQSDSKSPVSTVHELALYRRLDVRFDIVSESGPAHDRRYIMRCYLLNCAQEVVVSVEGEGGSKKEAKHTACEQMALKLKQMGWLPLPPNVINKKIRVPKEEKRKTITKEVKVDPNYGQQINPISRLIQIQQSKKEKEPTFQLLTETGQSRYKEFIIEVSLNGHTCQGIGPNKKLAKRAAAEAMLDNLGYSKPMPLPKKSALKQRNFCDFEPSCVTNGSDEFAVDFPAINGESPAEPTTSNGEQRSRKVTFQLDESSSNEDKMMDSFVPGSPNPNCSMPGILFVTQPSSGRKRYKDSKKTLSSQQKQAISTMAKSFLEKIKDQECVDSNIIGAKEQLEYLSGLLGFGVQFTDFPKTLRDSGDSEYLTLVTLGVSPPQVCHGTGPSTESAQNQAAIAALTALTAQGLDSVGPAIAPEQDGPCSGNQSESEPCSSGGHH